MAHVNRTSVQILDVTDCFFFHHSHRRLLRRLKAQCSVWKDPEAIELGNLGGRCKLSVASSSVKSASQTGLPAQS
jgi:hypothetical protein